jgi:hypothetical protein
MKVEQYLDGLLDKFRATAADDKSRPASKFLMVLVMLKTWFHRSKSTRGNAPLCPGMGQPTDTDTPAQTPGPGSQAAQQALLQHQQPKTEYSPANTPLQLLSEVATGSNPAQASRPDSRNQFAQNSEWSNGSQQPYPSGQDPNYNQMQPYGMAANGGAYNANIDPALSMGNMDFDFAVGEGFEQAMGMTLGDGGFGGYFSDDYFLGAMMDSVQGAGHTFEN